MKEIFISSVMLINVSVKFEIITLVSLEVIAYNGRISEPSSLSSNHVTTEVKEYYLQSILVLLSLTHCVYQSINQFIRQQRAKGHLQVAKYDIQ